MADRNHLIRSGFTRRQAAALATQIDVRRIPNYTDAAGNGTPVPATVDPRVQLLPGAEPMVFMAGPGDIFEIAMNLGSNTSDQVNATAIDFLVTVGNEMVWSVGAGSATPDLSAVQPSDPQLYGIDSLFSMQLLEAVPEWLVNGTLTIKPLYSTALSATAAGIYGTAWVKHWASS